MTTYHWSDSRSDLWAWGDFTFEETGGQCIFDKGLPYCSGSMLSSFAYLTSFVTIVTSNIWPTCNLFVLEFWDGETHKNIYYMIIFSDLHLFLVTTNQKIALTMKSNIFVTRTRVFKLSLAITGLSTFPLSLFLLLFKNWRENLHPWSLSLFLSEIFPSLLDQRKV